jgi:hypothetical protein
MSIEPPTRKNSAAKIIMVIISGASQVLHVPAINLKSRTTPPQIAPYFDQSSSAYV